MCVVQVLGRCSSVLFLVVVVSRGYEFCERGGFVPGLDGHCSSSVHVVVLGPENVNIRGGGLSVCARCWEVPYYVEHVYFLWEKVFDRSRG